MKGFLLDENLPAHLLFSPSLPVTPLSSVGLRPTDSQIWEFARQRELVIVSKDADFSDRIIIRTPPPWVVHIRFGNLRKNEFHALLARLWPQIETLLKSHKLVNVYSDSLEGIG
jgi:predicted nuclease of predicted toxin-antitoxin system